MIAIGGKQHAESPEWIPASSICCIIPAIYTPLPSEMASTSTSIALLINLSINIGLSSAALKASSTKFLSWFFSWTISIALPPKTYEGRTIKGRPILSAILIAWLLDFAIPLSACFNFNLIRSFLNLSLSSARSIEWYWVPIIGSEFL